jgi:Icc protein
MYSGIVDEWVVGVVTDLHFGPEVRHEGKLRKLSHLAEPLTRTIVREMNESVRPNMLVNLGDDIEDETRELDLERYERCQSILHGVRDASVVNVAGNHDTINLNRRDLARIWGHDGPLHYAFDAGGWHFVVLQTFERQGVDVSIPADQIEWARDVLARTERPAVVLMHHSASEQQLHDSRWFAKRPDLALVKERRELRRIFEESGRVKAVFNGHVHRNHLDVINGIAYVTFQSVIENVDDDAPGRPAAAYGVVRLTQERIVVRVEGNDPARYQLELTSRAASSPKRKRKSP